MKAENIVATGLLLGGLAVIFGALAAHSLEKMLEPPALKSFETAVRYQIFHAILLLFVGLWNKLSENKLPNYFFSLFVGGILCFSGSIYLLLMLKHLQISFPSILGLITPLGGVMLIAGWFLMAVKFLKMK